MKLFSIEEANQLIPVVRPKLQIIRLLYMRMAEYRDGAKLAASSAELGGGGMEGGSNYVTILYEIGKLTMELSSLGIELKDYTRGLIDFPCWRDGRVIYLCWQLGEADEIEWWHEVEAGFAGRQPL